MQQPFVAGQNAFPQQYALVPLNGSPGMMNGIQQSGFPPIGPSLGFGPSPGMAGPPQMMGRPAFPPGMNGFKCVHQAHMLLLHLACIGELIVAVSLTLLVIALKALG